VEKNIAKGLKNKPPLPSQKEIEAITPASQNIKLNIPLKLETPLIYLL
jgi:hypothetical protein